MWGMAAHTACCERRGRAQRAIQPVQISVQVKVLRYCPSVEFPQCATRSISRNPGRSSSHSVKVRTGMRLFSRLPGLVVLKPCDDWMRAERKQRSMLAELIFKSNTLVSAESSISLQRSNTLIASGKYGRKRLEQMRP